MTKEYFTHEISKQIWETKYQFTSQDDANISDRDVRDNWDRIAFTLSEVETKDPHLWYNEFMDVLEDFKFIPAGRIMATCGTGRTNATCVNCFVMGEIPDSMEGIFEALKEAALTMQQGGGIGYDFSTIRPKGALVKGVGAAASGPLPFMDTWDAMCKTVMSAGSRRGAMMATMDVSHPDIIDFIEAKRTPGRLRHFNLSVMVTDFFMECVQNDWDFDLKYDGVVYETVKARDLWNTIMESTYNYAEPGVLFIDKLNNDHNLNFLEEIRATNPCGEKGMGAYSSCLLGSINLMKFVVNPFTKDAFFDWKAFAKTARVATRMLDNVIEVTNYPLEKQRQKALNDRQLGLGITGLADALYMLGMEYGDDASEYFLGDVMMTMTLSSYETSIALAEEKGPCGYMQTTSNRIEYTNSGFVFKRLFNKHLREIERIGIRNTLLVSIAPTGTISLTANNISSGIEPVFAHSYTRNVTQDDGSLLPQRVVNNAVAEWERLYPGEEYPDYFVTAQDLTPDAHVRMQAVAQRWVDSSISKTVNVPEEITFDSFKDVYLRAWESGCKGCTTYRPNDVTGSILSVDKPDESSDSVEDENMACELRVDPDTGQLIKSCE